VARSADQETRIEIKEMIRGELRFVSDDGVKHSSGFMEAIVRKMPGIHLIASLPDTACYHVDLLSSKLRNVGEEILTLGQVYEAG